MSSIFFFFGGGGHIPFLHTHAFYTYSVERWTQWMKWNNAKTWSRAHLNRLTSQLPQYISEAKAVRPCHRIGGNRRVSQSFATPNLLNIYSESSRQHQRDSFLRISNHCNSLWNKLIPNLLNFQRKAPQISFFLSFCGGSFFVACEDFGRMFDHSFPDWTVRFFVCLFVCFKWR